jgi:hypothetical protein
MLREGCLRASEYRSAEQHIRSEAERLFANGEIGALYGALACGSDIIIAETALDKRIEFHAVLPLPIEDFVEASVAIGDEPNRSPSWRLRFESCLARSTTVTILTSGEIRKRDLDGAFHFGLRYAAGRALARAQSLETNAVMIAVANPRDIGGIASAATALSDWLGRGREARVIDFPFERNRTASSTRGTAAFAAVIFIFPEADRWTEDGADAIRREVESLVPAGSLVLYRLLKDRRFGFAIPFLDFDRASPCALGLLSSLKGAGIAARVICDFGVVLAADLKPDPELLAKLDGAADLVSFPSARPLATGAFAMEAVYRNATYSFIPVGRRIRRERASNSILRIGPTQDVFVITPMRHTLVDDFTD